MGVSSVRTLSQSDFVAAIGCTAKLWSKKSDFSDKREDPYLRMLAHGGYMVEALANTRYQQPSTSITAQASQLIVSAHSNSCPVTT